MPDSGYGNNSYGSNRYGNDTTSTGYGNHQNAFRDTSAGYAKQSAYGGGRDVFGKDPHQHWKENMGPGGEGSQGNFKSLLIHWPIQLLEIKLQHLVPSKADITNETTSVLNDVELRWLGIKNISNVFISLLSLCSGIIAFILVGLFSGNVILSYFILFVFLSHSFFPGYIITRMKRYVMGKQKTGKFVGILRRSWHIFEVIYIFIAVAIFYIKDKIDWISIKASLLTKVEHFTIFKKFLYKPVSSIKLEYMHSILNHLFNGMILSFILYMLTIYIAGRMAEKQRHKIADALDKEHLRPAEIIRNRSKRVL